MIVFLVFVVYPVLKAIWYSFTDYNVLEAANFVGLTNYKKLFLDDSVFITSIKNTFIIAVIVGPGGYILSFLLAWMLNELPHTLGSILTVIFYAPSMAGTAVVSVFTQIFADDSNGYLNAILQNLGITKEAILWLSDSDYVIIVVILASLWMSFGVGFLSFVAGIKGVDEAQYEAGAIDGVKNRFQELFYITLPMMAPHLMTAAVLQITAMFSNATVAQNLAGFPSTNYAGHLVMTHLMDYSTFRVERGYASAIAVLLFLIMIILNQIILRVMRKVDV